MTFEPWVGGCTRVRRRAPELNRGHSTAAAPKAPAAVAGPFAGTLGPVALLPGALTGFLGAALYLGRTAARCPARAPPATG